MTNIENRFYTTEHLDQLSQDALDRHLDGTSYDVPVGFTMAFNGEIALDKAFDYIVDTLKIDLPESSSECCTWI
jgi:hypothetical protein